MVLDEISSEKRRENCVCACFWESVHAPSVAIRRKSDVQVQIPCQQAIWIRDGAHGIWVGKAPMTDEHIILTENVRPESEIVAPRATGRKIRDQ